MPNLMGNAELFWLFLWLTARGLSRLVPCYIGVYACTLVSVCHTVCHTLCHTVCHTLCHTLCYTVSHFVSHSVQEFSVPDIDCNKCGEFKPESEYSVVSKASGRRSPTCKACRASAAKARRTAEPAGGDAKRHEAEPAERSADEAQLPADTARPADEARPADTQRPSADEADEALIERAIEVLVKSADVPTSSALCQCGRYNVLPGHSRCLRCGRYA
jgi:hypothetical protein